MKKYLVVVCSIILIVATSVNAFASSTTFVDWQIVDTVLNAEMNSQNCAVVFRNTSTPTPAMYDSLGNLKTQKTTYDVMLSMYETLSVYGVSLLANKIQPSVVEWYEYGGYCWIRIIVDAHTIAGANYAFWVGSFAGKILYCDAPDTGDTYTISAIAGSNYYLTDREPGTVGSSYLGDFAVSQANMQNISSGLTSLGGSATYYSVVKVVDGETRYYLSCMYPNRYIYYVCNNAGQLYYYVKEEAGGGGSGDGSSFDATEVITAINSVYDAIDIGFWDVCNWLEAIQDNITSFNDDVLMMSQNMVNGFTDLSNVGDNINNTLFNINAGLFSVGDDISTSLDIFRFQFEKYFESLGRSYPVLTTVKLSGEDNLFEWNEGDIITSARVENYDSDDSMIVHRGFRGNDQVGTVPTDVLVDNEEQGYSLIYETVEDFQVPKLVVHAPSYPDAVYYINRCRNGDFRNPKNTNGLTQYVSNGETIDDWKIYGGSGVVTVESSCDFVNYSVSTSDSYNRFYQELGIDYEVGSSYTLSILARVNSCSGTVYFRASSGSSGLVGLSGYRTPIVSSNEIVLITTTFKNSVETYGNARVELLVYDGASLDIDIYAIKVEKKSTQSLAFLGGDNQWYLFTDIYTPSAPVLDISGEIFPLSTRLSYSAGKCDYIYYDIASLAWKVYRYSSNLSFSISSSDVEILNKTIYSPSRRFFIDFNSFDHDILYGAFFDGVNTIDVIGDAIVTIDYYHTGTWFEYVYYMMDKLYDRIGEVDGSVVNIENTVVDILQDNDAFNIFYIEKTDGSAESVGDAAKDAAVFVGDILSMFYRLVFEGALDNVDVIDDFEDALTTTNTGVNVW